MGETSDKHFELVVRCTGDSLARVRSFAADIAARLGFTGHDIYDIKVAVGEAIANAIEHGSPRGEENHAKITCLFDKGVLTIKIIDEGIFRRAIPSPDDTVNYRGHGILLMLALMDRVTIDESPNGTTVSLTKIFRQDSEGAARTA